MAGPMIATGDEALRDLSEDEDSSDFDDNETNPFDRVSAIMLIMILQYAPADGLLAV